MRYVHMDSEGFLDERTWMGVIVPEPTGVTYGNQAGGVCCRHPAIEGYFVPVYNQEAHDELTTLFAREEFGLRGTDFGRFVWPSGLLNLLRSAVSKVWMAPSEEDVTKPAVPLRLDESRLPDADEAWIPVVSPDGPAVLVWANSD